jgi:hypothetical protein
METDAMVRNTESDWGQWAMARCTIAFALEGEVQDAADSDDLLWSLDPGSAIEAMERLGDAIAAALRDIAERPPPAALRPLHDALVRYLAWRVDLNDSMVIAAESTGWTGAQAVYRADVSDGLPFFHAFQTELDVLQRRDSNQR